MQKLLRENSCQRTNKKSLLWQKLSTKKTNKKMSMNITMNGGQQQQCNFVRLTSSDLESVYELELKAAKELPGIYIEKSRAFLLSCLEGQFTVGIMANQNLVGVLIISISDGATGVYAEMLGNNFQAGEMVAFREGSYLLPAYRGNGLALELASFSIRLLAEEGIKEVYSAVGPDHYIQLNRLTRSYGAVVQKFYNAISNGSLRYLMYYSGQQTYSLKGAEAVLVTNHSRQKELFGEGFKGTRLEFKGKEVFIYFQKPE
jgi:hypothetical protein